VVALRATTIRGIIPPVEPAERIATTERETAKDTTAPAAAHWLGNPNPQEKQLTFAQLLALEPEWTGPEEDAQENPADD
jgi:hypothetical protein